MRVAGLSIAAAALLLLTGAGPQPVAPPKAAGANCQNTGSFERWLEGFKRQATAEGIRAGTIQAALGGITLDQSVIARDRRQGFFTQTFLDFSAKLATTNRLQNSIAMARKHRATFDKAEKEYGVPAAVLTAFWALESDFGGGLPK